MATFFETADAFSAWLERHGATKSELIAGYHKRGTERGSMSWPESVDAALCFGWIDGVRKRIDEHCYQINRRRQRPSSEAKRRGSRNPKPRGNSSKRNRVVIGNRALMRPKMPQTGTP